MQLGVVADRPGGGDRFLLASLQHHQVEARAAAVAARLAARSGRWVVCWVTYHLP